MLSVLSPAKTLDFKTPPASRVSTQPELIDESKLLVDRLRSMSSSKLSSLMNISAKLGTLNKARYNSWTVPFTEANAKQAILAFKGDVYRGFDVDSLDSKDLKYAQAHLRILSGLYGVLRPLDLIQPYRLEMGTRLANERGKDLYEFWGDMITLELNQQLRRIKSNTLVNLASIEYFKSVDVGALEGDVVSPVFLDGKKGKYKIVSFYAKKARGQMAAWMIRNRVEKPAGLKKFDVAGYRYSVDHSDPGKPAFIRDND